MPTRDKTSEWTATVGQPVLVDPQFARDGILLRGEEIFLPFDVRSYLSNDGPGRTIIRATRNHVFFSSADPADSVFYLLSGQIAVSVVSTIGKEATIRLVGAGDFFGEQALAEPEMRATVATALTDCVALRILRSELLRVMLKEPSFSYFFSSFLLSSSQRYQADLVDHLFNGAERRLARLLLLLANNSRPEDELALIPDLSQAALANMMGSTRPRVNRFLNRFRKLGYIEYDGRIRVHTASLNTFLSQGESGASPAVEIVPASLGAKSFALQD